MLPRVVWRDRQEKKQKEKMWDTRRKTGHGGCRESARFNSLSLWRQRPKRQAWEETGCCLLLLDTVTLKDEGSARLWSERIIRWWIRQHDNTPTLAWCCWCLSAVSRGSVEKVVLLLLLLPCL